MPRHDRNTDQRKPLLAKGLRGIELRSHSGAAESFDVMGDPDALPDAFFDALAGLLMDIGSADESRQSTEKQSARAAD